MERLFAVCVLFFFLQIPANAKHFRYTEDAREAYNLVLSLRFEEAEVLLTRLRLREPDNLVVHHIENYIDFLTIYINEDKAEYNRLIGNRDERLALVEKGDPASPYFLFVQADIRLQWALAQLKFEEYFNAFREVSKAYKLLQKNREAFPDFMLNYKDLGLLHALVGTIPDNYKWGVKLLSGLEGSIAMGRRELELTLDYARKDGDFLFAEESLVFYAFLLLHLDNEEEAAWQTISSAGLDPRNNLLHCFVMANIAMRTGRNDKAIEILQQRPAGKDFFPFYYLDFMLGNAKLRRLDKDAHQPLERYVQRFDGRNFIKEGYQKLAWHSLVHGNEAGYRQYMNACFRHGDMVVDSDKSAQLEAEEKNLPDISLLKARLLFDGGYYQKAYQVLAGKSLSDFGNGHAKLEFLYRMGRILHGLGQMPQALHFYQLTIDRGRAKSYFFACNAALQAGLIYEKMGFEDMAIRYFEECLSLYPDEYRTGLHQKAKSGLARMHREDN